MGRCPEDRDRDSLDGLHADNDQHVLSAWKGRVARVGCRRCRTARPPDQVHECAEDREETTTSRSARSGLRRRRNRITFDERQKHRAT